MRYFLRFSYNGSPFHGWQRQPNASSVQQTLEEALSVVLRQEISIVGAGRTDTGVNARIMYAHFDADLTPQQQQSLPRALNSIICNDIAIDSLIPVAADAHARFDATERSYRYFVTQHNSAFAYPYCWRTSQPLDYDLMNHAAAMLLEVEDFTSFAKLHSDAKTNICNVTQAVWETVAGDGDIAPFMVFKITANRFLRNMVRAVVGTLVDVGRHKISLNDFADIIESKNRCAAGTSMPPQALFLWDIKYPYIP